jgi:hypothetical protein
MLPDIENYIEQTFPPDEHPRAKALVEGAVMEDGSVASPRCQRAALVGSQGSIDQLEYLVGLLKIDFRDVIVAGEYEGSGQNLRRVVDLTEPFSSGVN